MILDRVFAGIFGAAVHFRNQLYDTRKLQLKELSAPVVSIGNIRVGGAGKTPFVIALGELLNQRGISFDILSRGYGRVTKGVRFVDPEGTPQEYGDEPLLISRRLGVPVVVGEDRYAAGIEAERNWGPRLHLLDDAFQHRRLARQFDIVLLTPDDFRDVLLPAGRLREPLSSLRRADAIVLAGPLPQDVPLIPVPNIWHVARNLRFDNAPQNPVAFCAIARPQNFFSQLRAQGVNPIAEIRFRDHHRYTPSDLHRLLRVAQSNNAGGFVTTEKDAINLGSLAAQLPALSIARLQTTILHADSVLDAILGALAQRGKPAT